MKRSLVLLVILIVLITVFSVQNAEVVPISFVLWHGEISLAILMILTFLFGVIVGAIYLLYATRKRKNKIPDNIGDVAFDEEEQNLEEK